MWKLEWTETRGNEYGDVDKLRNKVICKCNAKRRGMCEEKEM